MSKESASSRLRKDYLSLKRDPLPFIEAEPLPTHILEWHFVFYGPENTPYQGGHYHGKLLFPGEFPSKPPSIYMITPNGRFRINRKLCVEISDYHPERWDPALTVSTILNALFSFMMHETRATVGSIDTSDDVKRQLALRSLKFNLKNQLFCDLFPDTVTTSINKIQEISRRRRLANTDVVGDNQTSNRSYRRFRSESFTFTEDIGPRRPWRHFTVAAWLFVCKNRIGNAGRTLLRSLRCCF